MLPIVSAMQLLAAADYTPLGPVLTGHEFPLLVQKDQVVYVAKLALNSELAVLNKFAANPTELMPRLEAVLEAPDCVVTVETLINGQTLAAAIASEGAFLPPQVDRVAQDILQSLAHLESIGMVHRDLKLSNIMVSHGRYYLIDISAARQQQVDQSSDTRLLGTTGFAAPENYGFAQTDGRSDIYSLGIVLNCLLTGQVPDSRQAVAKQLTTNPQWLPLIKKATAIDPQQRYQDAAAMLAALPSQASFERPLVTTSSTPKPHQPKLTPVVRLRLWVAYGVCWFLIIAVTLSINNWRDQLAFLLEGVALVGTPVLAHLFNRWLYRQFPMLDRSPWRFLLRTIEVILILVLLANTGAIFGSWGGSL